MSEVAETKKRPTNQGKRYAPANPFSPRFRAKYHVQTVESVKAALLLYRGNMAAVAKVHGVERSTTKEFIERHPELMDTLAEAKEIRLDRCELNVDRAVDNGDVKTSLAILDRLGRSRGYGKQMALIGPPGADGQPMPLIQIILPDNGRSTTPAVRDITESVTDGHGIRADAGARNENDGTATDDNGQQRMVPAGDNNDVPTNSVGDESNGTV